MNSFYRAGGSPSCFPSLSSLFAGKLFFISNPDVANPEMRRIKFASLERGRYSIQQGSRQLLAWPRRVKIKIANEHTIDVSTAVPKTLSIVLYWTVSYYFPLETLHETAPKSRREVEMRKREVPKKVSPVAALALS